jgi:hypothetical protein
MQELPDIEGTEGDRGLRSDVISKSGDTKARTEDQASHHGHASKGMECLSRSSTTVVPEDDAETESDG